MEFGKFEKVLDPRHSLLPALLVFVLGGYFAFATHTNTIEIPRTLRILNITSILVFPVVVGTLVYVYLKNDLSVWEPPMLMLWGIIGNVILTFVIFFLMLSTGGGGGGTTGSTGGLGVQRGLRYLEMFLATTFAFTIPYGLAAKQRRFFGMILVVLTPLFSALALLAPIQIL